MGTFNSVSNNLLLGCENTLGIYTSIDGSTLETVSIEDFCKKYSKLVEGKSNESSTHVNCGEYLTSLCYLNSVCNYSRISVLDFSNHKGADKLANFLIPFGKKKNLNKATLESVTSIVKYLMILESQSSTAVTSMSYRYIRLFIAFMWRHDYTHASIIARFLLDQLFIGSSLDDSVKQKASELKKARKFVESKIDNDCKDPSKLGDLKTSIKGFIDSSTDKADELLKIDRNKIKEEKKDKTIDKKSADADKLDKLRKLVSKKESNSGGMSKSNRF